MSQILLSRELSHKLSEPHSIIRVRNLQTSLPIGRDAWGRHGKLQPVLISVAISLSKPFESASDNDSVTESTVHYGVLSKAILRFCDDYNLRSTGSLNALTSFLEFLEEYLSFSGSEEEEAGVLGNTLTQFLEIKVTLPKASLLGAGITVTHTWTQDEIARFTLEGSTLELKELRIPTLIGVNKVERLAKQIVVANVRLDPWYDLDDTYNQLEEIVVKTIEESSFQTLEALATYICRHICLYFLDPKFKGGDLLPYPRIQLSLEKPTAVTFADAPMIEVSVDSEEILDDLQTLSEADRRVPPFPLNGRLDEWIQASTA